MLYCTKVCILSTKFFNDFFKSRNHYDFKQNKTQSQQNTTTAAAATKTVVVFLHHTNVAEKSAVFIHKEPQSTSLFTFL